MVIYPRGVRTVLATAYVRSYEKDQWDLASREQFATEEDAHKHARKLARLHNLDLDRDIPLLLDDEPAPVRNPGLTDDLHLYCWPSHALAAQREGKLIAMAATPDQARAQIRTAFSKTSYATTHTEYLLEEDLSHDPEVLNPAVVFIGGGED